MKSKSKLTDPGIILVGVLIVIAGTILVWWPKDIYLMGISLAGWLMFFSGFVWFTISLIYILWIERLEKRRNSHKQTDDSAERPS